MGRTFSDIRLPGKQDKVDIRAPEPKKLIRKDIRPRRFKWAPLITGIIVFLILGGLFLISRSSLALVIEKKKSVFDMGPEGLKISFPAKILTDTAVKRKEAESQSSKQFSERARGIIIVFNNYGPGPQVLVEETRFATPDGLIFRALERVTVPGKVNGKVGSVEVRVEASLVGEKYNIGKTDFKIPGFVGTPKFQMFYARSKTEMRGGAVGFGKVLGKEEAENLLQNLEKEMRVELGAKFEKAISSDYVVFPDKFEFPTTLRITDPEIGMPTEKFFGEVRGEAKTLGVSREVFSENMARVLFKDNYRERAYRLHETSGLKPKQVLFDYAAKNITVIYEGRAVFEWELNTDELRKKVLEAKDEAELRNIFKEFPAILKVEAVFKPRFLKRIPSKAERLTVDVVGSR